MALVEASRMAGALLDAALGFALVLNRHRQIVHIEHSFREYLATRGGSLRVGLRPGEALDCVNAAANAGGCGTAEGCRYCGAGQALARSLGGYVGVQERRIQTATSGDDLDLLVRTTPLELEGEPFIVCSAVDISHEKRRRALERIFFHDVTNTAGGIDGLDGIMRTAPPEAIAKRYVPMVQAASASLLDEISMHRDLSEAETGQLHPRPSELSSRGLLVELCDVAGYHAVGRHRTVELAPTSENVALETDRTLDLRVVGNLVKNAREAEPAGGRVTVSSAHLGDRVRIAVANPTPMPREVQLQVLQRSFSTKGIGRGLGTHSVRLLTERYLDGRVSFTSTPDGGTSFVVDLPRVLDTRQGQARLLA